MNYHKNLKGTTPPVVSQVTIQPIPTPNLDTHIEQQLILSKMTSVVSQNAPLVRKRKLRMFSSSDSEDDDLILAEIDRKKQLKASNILPKPK